jgi:hypothetical protein
MDARAMAIEALEDQLPNSASAPQLLEKLRTTLEETLNGAAFPVSTTDVQGVMAVDGRTGWLFTVSTSPAVVLSRELLEVRGAVVREWVDLADEASSQTMVTIELRDGRVFWIKYAHLLSAEERAELVTAVAECARA